MIETEHRLEITRETVFDNGAVIGCRGMSYEHDACGSWSKKPQPDKVVIEADVHIGANATIHRGGWRATHIKEGCRIGSQANVGHNVILGKNVLIAPQVSIAGSVQVEENVTIWQGAVIAQHLTIRAGAVIGQGAVVLENVPPGETWAGNPARKIK